MTDSAIVVSSPWYRSLNAAQWKVLLASNLGWLFDGFEIFALFVTVGFALHQLLDPSQYAAIPKYAGYILATTVFGWATGGVIGGIIADYIGRKRTMMLAILMYSVTTGLSALAWDWQSFAVLRFLVGSGSAPSGRPAPRSSPSCGRIIRAARAAGCCNAAPGWAASWRPASGCSSAAAGRMPGAGCI
jgi:MFS family permease